MRTLLSFFLLTCMIHVICCCDCTENRYRRHPASMSLCSRLSLELLAPNKRVECQNSLNLSLALPPLFAVEGKIGCRQLRRPLFLRIHLEKGRKANHSRRHHFWDSAWGELRVFCASVPRGLRSTCETAESERHQGWADNGSPGFFGKVLFVRLLSISWGNMTGVTRFSGEWLLVLICTNHRCQFHLFLLKAIVKTVQCFTRLRPSTD